MLGGTWEVLVFYLSGVQNIHPSSAGMSLGRIMAKLRCRESDPCLQSLHPKTGMP
ncbi:hypothetical protein EMIT047CA2_150098 [Pseudomonas soli]